MERPPIPFNVPQNANQNIIDKSDYLKLFHTNCINFLSKIEETYSKLLYIVCQKTKELFCMIY